MEPKIIFEDKDLLILDKPSGITVNRSETTKEEKTAQDFVETYLKLPKISKEIIDKFTSKNPNIEVGSEEQSDLDFLKRSGIVHRIDKETSGILLVAKTNKAFRNLQLQFKEKKVKKTYIALVHGKIVPEIGEIRVPLGRLPWHRGRFGVIAGGRNAVTRYRVISNFKFQIPNSQEDLGLLELYPETGRTHQIRVHLKHFGHPIFADSLYGGRKTQKRDRQLLPRLFLHAAKISFYHPKTNELLSFESPLPKDLNKFFSSLRSPKT